MVVLISFSTPPTDRTSRLDPGSEFLYRTFPGISASLRRPRLLFSLATTSALVGRLRAISHATGVHALAILAGIVSRAGLAAVSVLFGPGILMAALVTIGTAVARRHATACAHQKSGSWRALPSRLALAMTASPWRERLSCSPDWECRRDLPRFALQQRSRCPAMPHKRLKNPYSRPLTGTEIR